MPEAPSPGKAGGAGLGAVTRKLGPLPVWAWAAVVVLGFLAYRHFHGAPSTVATTQPQQGTTDQGYVPGFDAASQTGGGGIGSSPGNVYNYYYGDQAAAQAAGGGTMNADPITQPRPVDPGPVFVRTYSPPPPAGVSTPGPGHQPISYYVPAAVTPTPGTFRAA